MKCSKSCKMRAILIFFSLAYVRILKIIIECFVSQYEITLEEQPYTVAMPDVQTC